MSRKTLYRCASNYIILYHFYTPSHPNCWSQCFLAYLISPVVLAGLRPATNAEVSAGKSGQATPAGTYFHLSDPCVDREQEDDVEEHKYWLACTSSRILPRWYLHVFASPCQRPA